MSLLQKIALFYLRCISHLPFSGSISRAEKNRAHNHSLESILKKDGYGEDLITDQSKLESMHLGVSDMGYAGCEIISIYNAAALIGKAIPLSDIIHVAEVAGFLVRRGRWGTNPYRLDALGQTLSLHLRRTDSEELFSSETSGIYIVSFWNSNKILSGIHTVCISISDGKTTAYNLHYLPRPESGDFKKLFDGKPIIIAYRVDD